MFASRATKGLPVIEKPISKTALLSAGFVAFVSLFTYVITLAPTVVFVDSGELIVAARNLGVAHPPGFPLYVLLAHLATHLPLGPVAERVNFASALFAAFACSLLVLLVREMMAAPRRPVQDSGRSKQSRRRGKRGRGPDRSTSPPSDQLPGLSAAIPAIIAGLLLAGSRSFWGYATIAEVYSLNTLLVIALFLLVFRWRSGRLTNSQSAKGSEWVLYLAAFVFGIALGVHHVTVALTLPAVSAVVLRTEGARFLRSRALVYVVLFALAGASIYVYLPIAASRAPILNWGDPSSLERLWWHVTGRQFQTFLSLDPSVVATQVTQFARFVLREYGSWWWSLSVISVAAIGSVHLFGRDRTAFWFLILVIAANLAYAFNYEIAEDKDAYYLPTFVSLAVATGFGVRRLLMIGEPRLASGFLRWTPLLLFLLPALAGTRNFPYNDRSQYFLAHDYVSNMLSTVGEDAMLLTMDWQVYSPLLYAQEAEQYRIDVAAIDINLMRRSWYFEYLKNAYPAPIAATRDKIDDFLEDLGNWERDPDLYDRDIALNQRINARFYDMLKGLVTNHIRRSPVYITLDVAANPPGSQNSEFTQWISANYQLVPQGLVFELRPERTYFSPAAPELVTRGLNDGSLKLEEDDVVRVKVLPVYTNMLVNRGKYLAAHGHHQLAKSAFEEALLLDPRSSVARKSLEGVVRSGPGQFPNPQ